MRLQSALPELWLCPRKKWARDGKSETCRGWEWPGQRESNVFLRLKGIYIVDSPQRNPKGCKKVAGGRSPRRPPEKLLVMTAPRRGARPFDVKIFYVDL